MSCPLSAKYDGMDGTLTALRLLLRAGYSEREARRMIADALRG